MMESDITVTWLHEVQSWPPLAPTTTMSVSEPCDTVWPADSVEFCPHEESRNVFVCGTYKLEEDPSAISDGNEAGN